MPLTFTMQQARKYAGLTQSDVAEKLGIDRTTYIKIEKDAGRATWRQIMAFCEITKVPFDDLFLPKTSTNVED